MRLSQLENELKQRLEYPYRWGRKQNNPWDQSTNFIYQIPHFKDVLKQVNNKFSSYANKQQWIDYTLNRWYNFWSAWALEKVFCHASSAVSPASNPKDAEKDFFIQDIPFDHKTSVFPKNYPHPLDFAIQNPETLIRWLYTNQSQGNRLHHKNRIFIILYDTYTQSHWELKAYLTWLKVLIDYYVHHFSPQQLITLPPANNSPAITADIIWAIR